MIELIIGIIWETVVAIVTFLLWFTDTNVRVNGTYMNHNEFSSLLWPKILIGLFWIGGAIILIRGIRKILKNQKTEKNGEQCYGKICGIRPTGAKIMGKTVYKVLVATFIQSFNQTNILETEIGTDNIAYSVGTYVELKYYKGHTKIDKIIEMNQIPQEICGLINQNVEQYNKTHETVNINGVDITVEK